MRRVYQHARSRGIYARKHHGPGGEQAVQRLTAATFLARAALARVLPGYDGDDAARFCAHAQAALDPYAEPGIEEAADEHNRGVTA
jgi:hypothetical protein